MKQLLLFLIFLAGTTFTIKAQTEENLFEWKTNQAVAKEKFINLHATQSSNNWPTFIYKRLDVPTSGSDKYYVNITGVNKEMSEYGDYDMFEIYHNDKKILEHIPHALLYDVRHITAENCDDYFITVPLSNDSFALFFGGWFYPDGTPPEMVVVVVTGDTAKVVYDDYAYAYKYTPGENFAIEYVKDTEDYIVTESIQNLTKYKIWKEGNMLKYKSWK